MSSEAVRNAFRSSWPALVPSIPLVETINIDPYHGNMPDLWATVEFVAFNEDILSLGQPSCRRESGTITVVLSGRSGTQDSSLTSASETVRDAYRYWKDGSVRTTQIDPPLSGDGFSEGNWYIMDIDISYDYDRYI